MVVDHEQAALADLTQKLRTTFPGSVVKGYNNPIEPLQFAQKNKIDMLFTDVRLKPFDGYELVKILGQTQSFRSFVVSGTKEKPDDLSWMKVNGTFSKPVSLEELAKVRDGLLLQKSEPLQQKPSQAKEAKETQKVKVAPAAKPKPGMGR